MAAGSTRRRGAPLRGGAADADFIERDPGRAARTARRAGPDAGARRDTGLGAVSRTPRRGDAARPLDRRAAARRTAGRRGVLVEHDRQPQQPDRSAGTRRGRRWTTTGRPGASRRAQAGPQEKAPSRISDPADGQVPFQPWARARAQEFAAHLNDPTRPEYVEPFARCAPGGPTKSFMWHGYEIRQYPGYVVFLFDSGNRVIHLDGKPAPPETHQGVERRVARALGRQHAGRPRHQPQRQGEARPERRVRQRRRGRRRSASSSIPPASASPTTPPSPTRRC